MQVHVVALEGLHERLRHAVRLGRVRRRRADEEAERCAEGARFVRSVGRSVVAEPLAGVRYAHHACAEAMLAAVGARIISPVMAAVGAAYNLLRMGRLLVATA